VLVPADREDPQATVDFVTIVDAGVPEPHRTNVGQVERVNQHTRKALRAVPRVEDTGVTKTRGCDHARSIARTFTPGDVDLV
jgi:hypothetical protein